MTHSYTFYWLQDIVCFQILCAIFVCWSVMFNWYYNINRLLLHKLRKGFSWKMTFYDQNVSINSMLDNSIVYIRISIKRMLLQLSLWVTSSYYELVQGSNFGKICTAGAFYRSITNIWYLQQMRAEVGYNWYKYPIKWIC